MLKYFLNKMKYSIQDMPIRIAVIAPVLLCLLICFGWIWANYYFFNNNVPLWITQVIYGIAFLIGGISGIIQIIRRESPGFMSLIIEGKWAIVFGSLWALFLWCGGFLMFYFALTNTP